jgi:hypothetical protein
MVVLTGVGAGMHFLRSVKYIDIKKRRKPAYTLYSTFSGRKQQEEQKPAGFTKPEITDMITAKGRTEVSRECRA